MQHFISVPSLLQALEYHRQIGMDHHLEVHSPIWERNGLVTELPGGRCYVIKVLLCDETFKFLFK